MFFDTKEALILTRKYFKKVSYDNFKKMDDKDFVFVNNPSSTIEEKDLVIFKIPQNKSITNTSIKNKDIT